MRTQALLPSWLFLALWFTGGTLAAAGQATLPGTAVTASQSARPHTVSGQTGDQNTGSQAEASSKIQSGSKDSTGGPRLRVTWVSDVLAVAAENAGLNQILREISKQTGMKVTGGVADEHVYGTYGPGPAEMVLAALLAGTKSNMLLKQDTAGQPTELILTSRQGGPSPPSPASYASAKDEEDESVPARGSGMPGRRRPDMSGSAGPLTPSTQGAPGIAAQAPQSSAPSPDTPGSGEHGSQDQQTSSDPKSPQDIYDQLIKLQQQKAPPIPAPPQ